MATGTITRSPLAFGFGQMRLLPSEANGGDLNTLTENGIYSWGPGGKPANAPWNRGVVLQERISNDSSASESFQISASSKQNAKELKVRWRYSNNPIWDAWETIGTLHQENASTNAYGLAYVSNADKICGIVITDPVQCIPLYYSSSGIRVLKVTETSGTFTFSWLANTDITYKCVRG